jgi:tape measure domain-containing protein
MPSVDDRIVNMSFRGAGFLSGVGEAIRAMAALKNSLSGLKGAGDAIKGLDDAGKKFSLSGMGESVDKTTSKFSILRAAAGVALGEVASKAIMAGLSMVKSFTIAPILAGLHEYETELNATQTILANTGLTGQAGLNKVGNALNELNLYADKTIYSFGEMAANIGRFTAAGVDLKTSVASIKGLSNLAAMSGSSAEQASTAMYQLSQAISSGTVKLMDWNSVVNAGMGGKVFQNALIQTAKVHGVNVDAMIKKNGSFRDSLQEGWLSADIMTETLKTFTGDLSAAQLKAMGYTDAQTKAIMKQAKAANDAATKVKTVTQLVNTVGEAVGSAWADVWKALIGDMGQATTLLTKVNTVMSNMFAKPVENLAHFIQAWSKLGGRQALIDGLTSAFHLLGTVMHTIGSAFKDVFPPATAAHVADLTKKFRDFMAGIKLSDSTIQNLRSTFRGLFSVIKIVIDVIKGIGSVIGKMFAAIAGGSGSILTITGRLGDFISGIRKTIESGSGLKRFFEVLGNVLSAPLKLIPLAAEAFVHFGAVLGKLGQFVKPVISAIGNAFKTLGSAISAGIRSGDLSNIATVLNQVLFGGVLLAIRNFVKNIGKGSGGSKGMFSAITDSFKSLTGVLKAMQTNLNSGTLIKIAIAVGILAASLVLISGISVPNLTKSLTAITVMFTQLMTAMAIVSKISTSPGIIRLPIITGALILLATALLILAGAVAIMGSLKWDTLVKGLSGIAVALGLLVGATKAMSRDAAGLIATAAAMGIMAVALNLLAGAVGMLGHMNVGTLVKGVGAIAALLLVMAGFNKIGGKQLIGTAIALLILSGALNLLALAVKQLGNMPLGNLAKGLVAVAAGLIIISLGMSLMPSSMLLTSIGLLLVSGALVILAKALQSMGAMSWGAIGKSMVVLAGSLLILALAMAAMTEGLAGAAAMVVMVFALGLLVPILVTLGALSWGAIGKGLVAIAGAFVVIGLAGLLLGPIIPILLGVAAAIALMGLGMLAAGAGISLFAAGLTAMAIAVTASGGAIASFVTSILSLLPMAMGKFGEGVVAFATAIGKGAPALINAFSAILASMLNALIRNLPLILRVFGLILSGLLNIIRTYAPQIINTMINLLLNLLNTIGSRVGQFVDAGIRIIVGFLNGIARNIGRTVSAGVSIVVAFLNGISSNVGRVVNAGLNMVINTINAISGGISSHAGALRSAGLGLGLAIIDGMTGGLASAAGRVIGAAASIGSRVIGALGKAIKFFSPSHYAYDMGVGIDEGLSLGMENPRQKAVGSATGLGQNALAALRASLAMVQDMVELNPTITPVLDLSGAKRGFDDLAAMAAAQTPISTAAAAGIAGSGIGALGPDGVVAAGGTYVEFNQTNTSPKALSEAEIYRQTKNQLTAVKGALPVLCLPWSRSRTRRAIRSIFPWRTFLAGMS